MPSRCWNSGTRLSAAIALDQRLAAARDDDVDDAGHLQHLADGGAVGRRHQLDAVFRQAGGDEGDGEAFVDHRRGGEALRTAAEDGRVARLQAQPAGIGGDVRPRLVDDADDARAACAPARCAGRSAGPRRRSPGRPDPAMRRSPRGRRPSPRRGRDPSPAGRAAPRPGPSSRPPRRSRALAARMSRVRSRRIVAASRSARSFADEAATASASAAARAEVPMWCIRCLRLSPAASAVPDSVQVGGEGRHRVRFMSSARSSR